MGRWTRFAAALAAAVTPASVLALAAPASAATVVSPTNVGNTGQSTLSYIDRQITAGTGGFAYVRSTPGGRSGAWWGFPTGSFGPFALGNIPSTDYVAGVVNGLVVATDFNGNVAWEDVHGTNPGSGTVIPSGSSSTYTEDGSGQVGAAPGGWVTIGDTVVTAPATSTAHLLEVSTGGTVTDLGALGTAGSNNTSWTFVSGPNGVIYQTSTYDPTAGTSTNTAWTYVPYATPTSTTALPSDTSADMCSWVFSAGAICSHYDATAGSTVDVLVPLNGNPDTQLTLPTTAMFPTGTATDAAWLDANTKDVEYEPWGGGAITTVSSGSAIPAADLVSDGTNLIFGAALKATTAGLAEITPSTSSAVTSLNGEPIAATEASGVALTPGRVSFTDDHPAGTALSAGAGPLWDRTLTNSSGTMTAGSSPNLVVTDASDYSISGPSQISTSGRRTAYLNASNVPTVQDPAASMPESSLGTALSASSPFLATVSGSRVLWFNNTAGVWELRNLNTGTDTDLTTTNASLGTTIGASDSVTLWGNYIAIGRQSNGSVWRWDISNPSSPPYQVLASPDTSTKSCSTSGGPFAAGDYVAWSEDCYDPSTYTYLGPLSGYENVNTASPTAVDLSSAGYVLGLSGSYVLTAPSFPYPQNSVAITATQLGTSTTASPGSASGTVALDGSTVAWIDGNGAVQAESLPYVAEKPRYLGNGVAPSSVALPNKWNGEWDTSGALTTCSVTITQSTTTIATVPCNAADMTLGEAVVSWDGTNGTSQVPGGNYTWTLNASNAAGNLVAPDGSTLALTGPISVTTPLTITTASLQNAVVNSPYNQSITATGGTSPYTYSLASGSNSLPAGLNLNSTTGAITGTPTAAGSTSVNFQVTDSATPTHATVTKALTVTVNAPVSISTTSLAAATQNAAYDQFVTAAGGTTPYTFGLTGSSNPLPAGLSLNSSTGEITGTPTTVGSTTVTFQVTDSTTPTAGTNTKALTITVNPPPPNAPTGVTATAGVDSATLSWTAPSTGPTPTSYTVMSNPATSNLSVSSTSATVNGLTPGVSYTFTVEAADAGGPSAPSAPSNAVVPTSVAPQNTQTKTGSNPSATTSTSSSSSPSGTVTITANATGTGTVSVATYSSDPVGGFQAGSTYFDVSTTSDSSFTTLSFKVCGLASGSKVSWWNPAAHAWQPVSDATAVDSSGCSTVTVNSTTSPTLAEMNGTVFAVGLPSHGYTLSAADGGVFALGGAPFFGSEAGKPLAKPVVGMAMTHDGGGYWLVASDGGVFSFGDAKFYGSEGGKQLNAPVVGMAVTPSGNGYWLVASDGGVFSFGDAKFYGSEGGKHLNAPVVGMAADPGTGGYWLVASDGGIFSFNAPFYGSKGGAPLNKPVAGMAVDSTGAGYWLVASDGGIFSFGDAKFYGSEGGKQLNAPVVGMGTDPNAGGYWLFAADGGVFSFHATFYGSEAGHSLNRPVVGGAAG